MADKHKTTTKKKRTSRPNKDHLSAKEIRHFRDMLIVKRREIFGDVSNMQGDTLRKSRRDASGDLSNMPIHMADLGTDNYEQEFALELMDSERKLLREIDNALERIEEGTYGICEGTGQPISKARLEAQPWAKYCVDYARKLEQ